MRDSLRAEGKLETLEFERITDALSSRSCGDLPTGDIQLSLPEHPAHLGPCALPAPSALPDRNLQHPPRGHIRPWLHRKPRDPSDQTPAPAPPVAMLNTTRARKSRLCFPACTTPHRGQCRKR